MRLKTQTVFVECSLREFAIDGRHFDVQRNPSLLIFPRSLTSTLPSISTLATLRCQEAWWPCRSLHLPRPMECWSTLPVPALWRPAPGSTCHPWRRPSPSISGNLQLWLATNDNKWNPRLYWSWCSPSVKIVKYLRPPQALSSVSCHFSNVLPFREAYKGVDGEGVIACQHLREQSAKHGSHCHHISQHCPKRVFAVLS